MGVTNLKDINDIEKELLKQIQQRINFLYNLEPAQDNMFICSVITPIEKEAKSDGTLETNNSFGTSFNGLQSRTLYTAPYRLLSADFSLPTIDVEFDPRTRTTYLKGVTYNQKFTMTWADDCFHSVRKYHHDWFNCWFQREKDAFVSGIGESNPEGLNGRFRAFKIFMYHMVHDKDGKVIPNIWGVIDVGDAFPINLGKVSLGEDPGDSKYTCEYAANFIDLKFANSETATFPLMSGDTNNTLLQNMGFSESEIKRLSGQFTNRDGKIGENFLH